MSKARFSAEPLGGLTYPARLTLLWFTIVLSVAAAVRGEGPENPVLVLDAGGHTARVKKVFLSRDDKELISVGEDTTIRVWDVASGETLRVHRPPIGIGRVGMLYTAAVDPTGTTLAMGGIGFPEYKWGNIYLISLETGQIERVLTGHEHFIHGLAFSPDGQRLISGSRDQTARIWSVRTGKTEQVLRGHTDTIYGVTFSPDGRRCATASDDHTAAVWNIGSTLGEGSAESQKDAVTLSPAAVLKGHSARVPCIAWRPDGLVLATGSEDYSIRFWSPEGKAYQKFDKLGERGILSISFTADSRRLLYTQGYGATGLPITAVLDVITGRELARFDQHTNTIMHGTLSRDGTLAATAGGNDEEIFLWKTADGTRVRKFVGRGLTTRAAAWSPDGARIAWGNKIVGGGSDNNTRPLERTFDIASLEFGPAPNDRFVRARLESGSLSLTPGPPNQSGHVDSVVVRQGDRTVTTLSSSGLSNRFNCFTWLPGDQIAVGTAFGLELYDARTGKNLSKFLGHTGEIWAVSVSPDGRYLLSASSDKTLRIWDPKPSTTVSLAGIGAALKKIDSGFEIEEIVDGSPASTDGRLKVGDLITAVDQGAGQFAETATLALADVVSLIRGEVGTKVRLKVKGKENIELTRGGVSITQERPLLLPLLSLFFAGDDWIAWTPEGYYAASPGGEKLMGWHVNNGHEQMASYYPASQFRSTLYRPDVIKRLLKAGSVDQALIEADKARSRMTVKTEVTAVLPPKIKITAPTSGHKPTQNTLEVRATASSTGTNPITAMRLLLDGRPYQGLKGTQTIADPKLGDVEKSWQVELEPGKHKFVVLADSAVSQGVSEEVEVAYVGGDSEPVQLPKLYLVAIGISEYPGELKLNYAAKDAEALGTALKSHSKSLFRDIEVQTITDATATRAGMLKGLSWLRGQMTQNDYGIFFFAGHGDLDNDGALYFLPVDADPNDLVSSAVPADQVKRVLSGIPGKLITMLDACHSAGIAGSQTGKRRAARTSLTDDLVRDLVTDENGVIAMCSSTGREFSLENNEFRQGSFTLSIVEGLSGKADFNKDGVVYLNELDTYVTDRVKELTKGQQHPVTAKPGSIRSFPLAKP